MHETHDEFLQDLYNSLHDSSRQRWFKTMCPMPFGVVFLPWAGMKEEEMRQHFRWMKELGFTNLKQTMDSPEWPSERILEVALEEGIIPFWYGDGGWEPFTPELLDKLGIPRETSFQELRANPKMIAYQKEVIRKRIRYGKLNAPEIEGTNLQVAGLEKWSSNEHIQLHNDPTLRPEAIPLFKTWVKDHYINTDELNRAWNCNEVGITAHPFKNWVDFDTRKNFDDFQKKEYRFIRDVLRFKADVTLARIRKRNELARERDPYEPQRAGGEMGLFLPFAWRGTDMEGFAEEMAEYGSFYPSLHLAWHFEEVEYEVARCIYMQASVANDWFKGGWSATWESTGGPQQFSGAKGWNAKSGAETPGFSVDAGTITQLLLSYLAAGFKGVGLWAWNYRRAGWEAGEYALCNRHNKPGARAKRAGEIAKAAIALREELWAANKQPQIGVFISFDNECIWAANSVPNRDHFRFYPIHARIGVSRALINGNIPWEHLTPRDLHRGLAARYKVIYLPAHLSLAAKDLEIFERYVEHGGRLVMDAPGGWFDENGRVLNTERGSIFERIFGAEIDDFQYSNNTSFKLHGEKLEGFTLDLNPTSATVLSYFENGQPAVTENKVGKGSAVILGYEASRMLFKPGHTDKEVWLRRYAVGGLESPYGCADAVVYKLAAPRADHYFFINDDNAKTVHLDTKKYQYKSVSDPVSGERLELGAAIALEGYSARWLRFETT